MKYYLCLLLRAFLCNVNVRGGNRFLNYILNVFNIDEMPFSISFNGMVYNGNLNNYIDRMAFFYGAYEKPLLDYMTTLSAQIKDCVFVDVGANIGHHTLYMSKSCSKVHSFEPLPSLHPKIIDKIKTNNIENITLHKFGLADKEASLEFFPPDDVNEGQGSFAIDQSMSNKPSINLEVVVGDDYLMDRGVNKIDILKIDVEGFEPQVIKGLSELIKDNTPIIICEISDMNKNIFSSEQVFLRLLPENTYKLFIFKQTGTLFFSYKLIELDSESFELFSGNIICLPGSVYGN